MALFLPASIRGIYVTIVLFATMATAASIGVFVMMRPARCGSQDSDNYTQVDETREDDAMLIYATAGGLIDWTGCAHGPEYKDFKDSYGYDPRRDDPDGGDSEDFLDFEDSNDYAGASEEFD
jgi:hypothetical protein